MKKQIFLALIVTLIVACGGGGEEYPIELTLNKTEVPKWSANVMLTNSTYGAIKPSWLTDLEADTPDLITSLEEDGDIFKKITITSETDILINIEDENLPFKYNDKGTFLEVLDEDKQVVLKLNVDSDKKNADFTFLLLQSNKAGTQLITPIETQYTITNDVNKAINDYIVSKKLQKNDTLVYLTPLYRYKKI
jgi:hypothetical protein